MAHLGHRQINKVIITQRPPNRSGRSLIDKTSNTVHLGNASYMRGTETAKVEGLWLSKRPFKCVSKHPDDNTAAAELLEPN